MATKSEQLRHAAREVLALRPGTALQLEGIGRRIRIDQLVDGDVADVELRQALAVLIALDQVSLAHDGLGSTEYFQITGDGILKYERGE